MGFPLYDSTQDTVVIDDVVLELKGSDLSRFIVWNDWIFLWGLS